MKNINNYISEKLNVKDIKIKNFTDEELLNDYETVRMAYTKKEKEPLAIKYDVSSIKMRDIELAILDKLRENRFNKKEYERQDISNFYKYDIPDRYDRLKIYLDKEPKEFIKYLLDFLIDKAKKYNKNYLSPANKHTIRTIANLKKYLIS